MEEKSDWAGAALAVSIAAVTSIGASMALMWMIWTLPDRGLSFKDSDPAAWVQAIGSVAAILVSAGTVGYAHKLEKRRAEEGDRERYGKAAILFDDLTVRAEHVFKHIVESTGTDNLRFMTYHKHVPRWLTALDALVHASRELQHGDFATAWDLRVYLDFRTNLEAAVGEVRSDLDPVHRGSGLMASDFDRRLRLLQRQQAAVRESAAFQFAMARRKPAWGSHGREQP